MYKFHVNCKVLGLFFFSLKSAACLPISSNYSHAVDARGGGFGIAQFEASLYISLRKWLMWCFLASVFMHNKTENIWLISENRKELGLDLFFSPAVFSYVYCNADGWRHVTWVKITRQAHIQPSETYSNFCILISQSWLMWQQFTASFHMKCCNVTSSLAADKHQVVERHWSYWNVQRQKCGNNP